MEQNLANLTKKMQGVLEIRAAAFKFVPKGMCRITLTQNVPDILLPHSD